MPQQTITWKQTGLGVWYPTIDGLDAYETLKARHGRRFADLPVFNPSELDLAHAWATERGYASEARQ